MKKIKLISIHSLTPLLLGGLLYISFRSTALNMFTWFKYIGIDNSVSILRQELSGFKLYLPPWTYYSLPDGLWVYSFTSAILILWSNQFDKAKFWLFIPLFSGTIIEIAQGLKIFPGTFDILDLTFTTLALLLSIVIINYKFKQHDKQKQVF